MADSKSDEKSPSPTEGFLEISRTELTQVRNQTKEIALLVEQSQGEVDKLVQRNASITAQLHQIQSNFDTVPREDIRTAYEAAQDTQQRLFTMRGQVEKLQSDLVNLKRYSDYLAKTVLLLSSSAPFAPGVVTAGGHGGEIHLLQQLIP